MFPPDDLHEPFELTGHWWLPHTTTYLPGTLRFDPVNRVIELKTIGKFSSSKLRERIVYGKAASGESFTLHNLDCVSWDVLQPESAPATYAVERILGSVDLNYTTRYDVLAVRCSDLVDWIDQRVYCYEEQPALGPLCGKGIPLEPPQTEWKTADSRWSVTVRVWPQVRFGRRDYSIKPEACITIRSSRPCGIERWIDQLLCLRLLLGVFVGRAIAPTRLTLSRSAERKPELVTWHELFAPPPTEHLYAADHLFTREAAARIPGLIDNWYRLLERQRTPIELGAGPWRDGEVQAITQFLTICQALEAFHKTGSDEEPFVSPKRWECLRGALLAVLPATLTSDERERFEGSIGSMNNLSLQTRLERLLIALPHACRTAIESHFERFASDVVWNRNFLTHHTDPYSKRRFNAAWMLMASERLELLLALTILRELGASEKDLLRAVDTQATKERLQKVSLLTRPLRHVRRPSS